MNPSPAPNFALMSSVDISNFDGTFFTRSSSISEFSFTKTVYEDMISFLNGRGMSSGKDLSSLLLASSNFGTDWNVGIDKNDKVEINSTHDFKIKFNSSSSIAGNTDVFGIGTSFVNTTGGATIGTPLLSYKVTSLNEWTRGEVISFSYNIEEIGGSSASFVFNFTGGAQDLIVACRSRGNADIDDSSECLESVDITKHPGNDIRWYINNDGKVVCSYITVSNITWSSSAFRNRLGFTGEETVETVNFYSVVTASNYCPGVLVPSRPYQNNHLSVENASQSRRSIGGSYVSNYIGTYVTSNISFDVDARLDQIDLYRHFTNNFISYISSGERINFYQVLGDSRRSLIEASANAEQPAHDLVYTSSRNGYEGRIRGSLINSNFNLQYPTRLRKRVPVAMRIDHL